MSFVLALVLTVTVCRGGQPVHAAAHRPHPHGRVAQSSGMISYQPAEPPIWAALLFLLMPGAPAHAGRWLASGFLIRHQHKTRRWAAGMDTPGRSGGFAFLRKSYGRPTSATGACGEPAFESTCTNTKPADGRAGMDTPGRGGGFAFLRKSHAGYKAPPALC